MYSSLRNEVRSCHVVLQCVKAVDLWSDTIAMEPMGCHCAFPYVGGTDGVFNFLKRLRVNGNRYSMAIVLDHATSLTGNVQHFSAKQKTTMGIQKCSRGPILCDN